METGKLIKKIGYSVVIFIGIITIIILAMLSQIQHGQWIFFKGAQISGTVIDNEKGKPIEGTVVIGMWPLTQLLSEGFGGYANIVEVTTDKDGKFIIPSWTAFKPWKCFTTLHDLAPRIVIYKPGYLIHVTSQARIPAPYPQMMTDEELKKYLEDRSINPAIMKKLYSDEQICESFINFESFANFPDNHYSKKQLKEILDSLEKGILQIPINKNNCRHKILRDITEYRKYWIGGGE